MPIPAPLLRKPKDRQSAQAGDDEKSKRSSRMPQEGKKKHNLDQMSQSMVADKRYLSSVIRNPDQSLLIDGSGVN